VFQSALIPVSQAGSQRAGKIRNPAVGCHYFLPSAHPPSHKVPNYSLLLVSGVCAYKVVTQKQNGVSQTVKPQAYNSTTIYTETKKRSTLLSKSVINQTAQFCTPWTHGSAENAGPENDGSMRTGIWRTGKCRTGDRQAELEYFG